MHHTLRWSALFALLIYILLATAASPAGAEVAAQGASSVVVGNQQCLPDNWIRITASWTSSVQGPQWADLSLSDNGFAAGTFFSLGPLQPGQSSVDWDGLLPGHMHYLRINTLTSSGWVASETVAFTTRSDCAPPGPVAGPGDTDADGVPDASDSCPTQIGLAAYAGCPPPSTCSSSSSIVDQPQGYYSGCVWHGKADFDAYAVGEQVVYCYSVNQPMAVRVEVFKPDGTVLDVVNQSNGDGGCVGPFMANYPLGLRHIVLYGGPAQQLLDDAYFFVR